MWLCLLIFLSITEIVSSLTTPKAPCMLPPDLWCDHPVAAIACTGSLRYCDQYKNNRKGKKFELTLAFESACPDSQQWYLNAVTLSTCYPRNFFPILSRIFLKTLG